MIIATFVWSLGASHSAKQTASTPFVLMPSRQANSKQTVNSAYIYIACDRVRASQPALISEASTLIGWPPSCGHCINMRLQARSKHTVTVIGQSQLRLQEKHRVYKQHPQIPPALLTLSSSSSDSGLPASPHGRTNLHCQPGSPLSTVRSHGSPSGSCWRTSIQRTAKKKKRITRALLHATGASSLQRRSCHKPVTTTARC
jgi:riboflavin biosynthesis pyrimidine reductase